MFIFRVEHKREFCGNDPQYRVGGTSATGHGPYRKCEDYYGPTPNFGTEGCFPQTPMMVHERCAVTSDQWNSWVSPESQCRNFYYGDCEDYCGCLPNYDVQIDNRWHIVAYWVEDNAEGIDWRFDAGQIVFNPAFAVNMGSVTVDDVYAMHPMNV